ncbi:hypothetical protein DE146DRAFT_434356 [Phaeosphaeria sp. MPI-PUGE-AT-0046c]|nr:hypothetical protein DE146DRAFT_434356 [Phaeosphaeria sp. MPI-PUGE-AT-0046c]
MIRSPPAAAISPLLLLRACVTSLITLHRCHASPNGLQEPTMTVQPGFLARCNQRTRPCYIQHLLLTLCGRGAYVCSRTNPLFERCWDANWGPTAHVHAISCLVLPREPTQILVVRRMSHFSGEMRPW